MEEVTPRLRDRLSVRTALFATTFACAVMILIMAFITARAVYEVQNAINYRVAFELPRTGRELNWLERMFQYNADALINTLIALQATILITLNAFLFYRWKLKKPLVVLKEASDNIRGNNLDFRIIPPSADELGMLCLSFEKMRGSLQITNQELWKAVEERRRLNAAFAHDLRTPVTVLRGYAEMLLQNGLPPESEQVLRVMERQILRLDQYLNNINSVKTLGETMPEPRLTDAAFIRELQSISRAMYSGTLVFNSPEHVPQLFLDTRIVVQVFQNIMANAVRYARQVIKVSCEIMDGFLYITTSDDGQGFSAEALNRAAEPYYRAESDDNEHFGLGLYICKVLCERCGGKLMLSSPPAGGAEVTAKFPCAE